MRESHETITRVASSTSHHSHCHIGALHDPKERVCVGTDVTATAAKVC